jgi:plasmid stabilization system protein ParE
MPARVTFRREARTEFRDAARRYEQSRTGLGERFTAAVLETVDRIVAMPDRFAPLHGDCRRALVPHFPYAVFFRLVAGRVRIVSVFHTSRDPVVWQQRADNDAGR